MCVWVTFVLCLRDEGEEERGRGGGEGVRERERERERSKSMREVGRNIGDQVCISYLVIILDSLLARLISKGSCMHSSAIPSFKSI